MRIPGSVKIGITLIVLGAGCYFGVQRWMSTRIVHPVDMPISLAKGHIRTGPFRLNLKTNYWVTIDPGEWWKLGADCASAYRSLNARWDLYLNGRIVDRQDEPVAYPTAFTAASGVYELDIQIPDRHLGCLDRGRPRLEVNAYTGSYDAGALLLKAISALAIGFGAYMLTFLPLVRFVGSREHALHLTDPESLVVRSFQRSQKLPPGRPMTALPSFGLIAATTFALAAMAMMVLTGAFQYQPRGLWVHLLKPGAAPEQSDKWTDALIVRVVDAGLGQGTNLLLNSRPVTWDNFGHELREELGRRREWVVYVEGDYCVAWINVAEVIDVAHDDHANVFLITREEQKECLPAFPRITQ
jgi:biopolymer transport protein ExbD